MAITDYTSYNEITSAVQAHETNITDLALENEQLQQRIESLEEQINNLPTAKRELVIWEYKNPVINFGSPLSNSRTVYELDNEIPEWANYLYVHTSLNNQYWAKNASSPLDSVNTEPSTNIHVFPLYHRSGVQVKNTKFSIRLSKLTTKSEGGFIIYEAYIPFYLNGTSLTQAASESYLNIGTADDGGYFNATFQYSVKTPAASGIPELGGDFANMNAEKIWVTE